MISEGAPSTVFEHDHSSLLCQVIANWLQSTFNAYGRINWRDIATLLNIKVAESGAREAVTYTDLDCHKHWRYLAYGELCTTDERTTADEKDFQHSEDTDEDSFFMYPMQAIARRKSESRVLLNTKSTVDDTSEFLNHSDIRKFGDATVCSSSSSVSAETPANAPAVDDNSVINAKIAKDRRQERLLSKPTVHRSRSTKMFVPNQVHAGLVTMQHIVYCFSGEPFQKTHNNSPTTLCLTSLGDNGFFAQGKRALSRQMYNQPTPSAKNMAMTASSSSHAKASQPTPRQSAWNPSSGNSSGPSSSSSGAAHKLSVGSCLDLTGDDTPTQTQTGGQSAALVGSNLEELKRADKRSSEERRRAENYSILGQRHLMQLQQMEQHREQQMQRQYEHKHHLMHQESLIQQQHQYQLLMEQNHSQPAHHNNQNNQLHHHQMLQHQFQVQHQFQHQQQQQQQQQMNHQINVADRSRLVASNIYGPHGPHHNPTATSSSSSSPGEPPGAGEAGVLMNANEREREREGTENYFERARSHFFGAQTARGPIHTATNTATSAPFGSIASGSSSRITDWQPIDIPSHPNSLGHDSTRVCVFQSSDVPGMPDGNNLNSDMSPKSKVSYDGTNDRDRDSSSEKKRKRDKLHYVNFAKMIPKNESGESSPLKAPNEDNSNVSHLHGQHKRYYNPSDERLDCRLEAPHSMPMPMLLHSDRGRELFRDVQRPPPAHQSTPSSSSSSAGVPMPTQHSHRSSQQRIAYGEHTQSHGHSNSVDALHSAASNDIALSNNSNGHPSRDSISSSSVTPHTDEGLSVLLLALSAPQGKFPLPSKQGTFSLPPKQGTFSLPPMQHGTFPLPPTQIGTFPLPPMQQRAFPLPHVTASTSTSDFGSHVSTDICRTISPQLNGQNTVRSNAGAGRDCSDGNKSLTTRTPDPL